RAFGRLPDNLAEATPEQTRFLDEAVNDLAEDGKIIPVRLSLFAEIVKSKPWTPATLKQSGGTRGRALMFLEEEFSAATAPPARRESPRRTHGRMEAPPRAPPFAQLVGMARYPLVDTPPPLERQPAANDDLGQSLSRHQDGTLAVLDCLDGPRGDSLPAAN